ncbi:MAG: NRDE family protein [Shewanella sp.]|nr:NRDE family protein [Shewanella sp.]MCF1431351.1 NRDE family protein [Shewanella sp.]MCF1438575.1 NRDE family protein [Shewanella sp.]MCF1458494.1 NRDE family protein [Shewanella sp.]
MCILFIAQNRHPDYPLIICANRDEFHHRATQYMHKWPGNNGITAGKDLKAGGTWLGFNAQGEVSALTNIRDLSAIQEDRLSRGELVLKALKGELSDDWLKQHSDSYNPFNLLYEQQNQLYVFNSRSKESTLISDGFHAVSNGDLDDIWPKMAKGKMALEQAIVSHSQITPESLLPMMLDQTLPPQDSLPNTGVSLEWERRLSSIFICHPEYGTRSTSILLWHRSGNLECLELRYNPKGKELSRDKLQLQLTQSDE